jgi:hypothetical protein
MSRLSATPAFVHWAGPELTAILKESIAARAHHPSERDSKARQRLLLFLQKRFYLRIFAVSAYEEED